MLLLATFDLSSADIEAFDAYEAAVLPLLEQHGAALKYRVRSLDNVFEIHLLEFADQAAFDAYRNDPARQRLQPLFERSGAEAALTPVVGL
ncbi:hypothetical protein [Novosphingobium sp. JCM 18896]|uniref:hypothetical protein n=1 Tax=Novosphingobium sp. JCM 18896 TaxID=2989731 RepID=UPI0022233853|nr:hypothetical protein [Novosphingobium sp. JCM 18896]MCW1430039.1 hypothetical protein [Novosphingobium sp. JCM 18896]